MKKHLLTYLIFLSVVALLPAQTAVHRAGEILIQLNADASLNTALNQLSRAVSSPVTLKSVVAPNWQIYLLGFDEKAVDPAKVLAAAKSLPDIRFAQWNHRAYERNTTPNDANWAQQDDMDMLGMPQVWDVTTGGRTPAGDSIVVAVLEKGALRDHPDLAPNMWFNRGEIPGNNIDDDGNGYTDDYSGYNPRTHNDDPGDIGFHGTAVNGIIGAKGNNSQGVAGMNWNVRLMNLGNVEYESEIIAGYAYVADMRRLYNTSNGAKGAFVTATNASFGIDFERAANHPLWCAAYDSLGAVGVISVGATANGNVDVDQQGDMPSTCNSPYLIVVTNVDDFGKKAASTGYGKLSVDLGAPGQSVFTTRSTGTSPVYGYFDGTSASTPHVSGAIGLLYSLNCAAFTSDALTQPAVCAKRVRDLILSNVTPVPTLADVSTTGGRLNMALAAQAVQDLCGGATTGPLQIDWIRPNPVHSILRASFQTPTFNPYKVRIFNVLGQLMHEETYTPDAFTQTPWQYDVSWFPSGVYVISMGRNDAVRSEKFVKN